LCFVGVFCPYFDLVGAGCGPGVLFGDEGVMVLVGGPAGGAVAPVELVAYLVVVGIVGLCGEVVTDVGRVLCDG